MLYYVIQATHATVKKSLEAEMLLELYVRLHQAALSLQRITTVHFGVAIRGRLPEVFYSHFPFVETFNMKIFMHAQLN